ncbi:MAG: hypothetical protein J6A28_02615 [Clostridia bacterium]|nr:hypothetical protein [Clostridia bacterium]
MHKFFCNYNRLTERYELSKSQGIMFGGKVNIQAENTLLPQIRSNLQALYELIVTIKDNEKEERRLALLDETELLLSNLFYSLFASPLDLPTERKTLSGNELASAIAIVRLLERDINIPEYNRMALLLKNNLLALQTTV